MEINEALDRCVAGLMAPSERLLAMATRLAGDVPAPAPPAGISPAGPPAGHPASANTHTRNRAVLGNARAVLSETLGQIGLAEKD